LDGRLIRRPAKDAGRKCEPCLVRVSRRRVWSLELLLLSLRCHGIAMVQPAESRKGLNLVFTRRANFCCTTCWRVLRESKMSPVFMVQLDNATPIILNREKAVTFGTLGTLAPWLFTKPSPEMGELCSSVASMRSQELGSWRSHNGCSIRWLGAACPWQPRHCQLRCVAGFEGPASMCVVSCPAGTRSVTIWKVRSCSMTVPAKAMITCCWG